MLSQNQHDLHLLHIPRSKKDYNHGKPAQQNLIYLAITLFGGILLVAKPALIIFILILMGYGKYYHVETHEKPYGLLRQKQSEHSLHFGPDRDHRGQKRAGFQDLAKGLNLPMGK